MFLENKYTKIYFALMEKAKLRKDIELFEMHHIIPKSLGGTNSSSNLVKLSPREHFIAHAVLTKMVHEKLHKRSMVYAFVRMKVSHNKQGYCRIGNGKLYETLRSNLKEAYSGENNPFYGDRRFLGKNNPFYGKKHSNETKRIIGEKNRKSGKDNHFYGKKHSEKTRKAISNQQREPVTIIFTDGTQKQFFKKGDIGPSVGLSVAMGIQLCSIKRHLWDKYNIKEILYENNFNQKS